MRKVAVTLILLVMAVVITACESGACDPKSVGNSNIVMPVDYGNGVYYFYATGAEFANSLSKFLGDHPGAEVMAMTGDGNHGHGVNYGHFVVIRLKPEKE